MLSVFLPTIRTHLLEKWYDSLEKSCSRHPFEAIFCGPFKIPESLITKPNVRWYKDFGNPTRAAQIAAIYSRGDYLYHTVDDVLFYPDVISDELDKVGEKEIVALRYREGQNFSGHELPTNYWYATNAYPGWRGVNQRWGIGIHFLMNRNLFLKYGGFDCEYEYLNHATHDLLFRMQNKGISYRLSEKEASTADWMPGTSGDHAPIHHAQITHDEALFASHWAYANSFRDFIPIDNWKNQPNVWERRFPNDQVGSYEELYKCKSELSD